MFYIKGNLYLITNTINNKKYVGKTYRKIEERWKEHLKESRSNKNEKIRRPLYNAIKKYGIENFKIELLGIYDEGLLELKEIEFINKYNTYYNGYNATTGGDGYRKRKVTDKNIILEYKKCLNISEVHINTKICKEYISLILKNYRIDILTPGDIAQINKSKKVFQFSFEGCLIHEFFNASEAVDFIIKENHLNVANKNNIRRNLSRQIGTKKDFYGYYWGYDNNFEGYSRKTVSKESFYILQKNKDNVVINNFSNLSEAGRWIIKHKLSNGKDEYSVSSVIRNSIKRNNIGNAYGFSWERIKVNKTMDKNFIIETSILKDNKEKDIEVNDLENILGNKISKIYNQIDEALKEINLVPTYIYRPITIKHKKRIKRKSEKRNNVVKLTENKCPICGTLLKENLTYCSQKCSQISQQKATRPTRDELKNLIRTTPFTTIASQYNVSDNAIRKWCITYNLPHKSTEIKKITDEEWKNI